MSKKDLFVIIYATIWASVIVIGFMYNYFNKWVSTSDYIVLSNFLFLSITSSFVFIKPIRNWVNKYIIEKLP